jgi:predicted DNA-binding ribbon-helix-helix protein
MLQIEPRAVTMTQRRLPVPLTDEQWEVIERLATNERRSMGQQVVKIVDEWIQKYQGDRTKSKGVK